MCGGPRLALSVFPSKQALILFRAVGFGVCSLPLSARPSPQKLERLPSYEQERMAMDTMLRAAMDNNGEGIRKSLEQGAAPNGARDMSGDPCWSREVMPP